MNKVLFLGGPTGIGKSDLAVRLAKLCDGVIIGADAMQIYRGMDIGTGKVTEEEKQGVLHTMIDIVQPDEEYSVQKYHIDAKKCIEKALSNEKLPIVVGGTGLYIHALLNEQNYAQAPPDPALRARLKAQCEREGTAALHAKLRSIDAEAAAKISQNDERRIIRALEIYEQTGQTKTAAATGTPTSYDYKFFVLDMPREKLYARIQTRVVRMFEQGLTEEVLSLKPYWHCRSMQAIGYKECIVAWQNGTDPRDAVEEVQRNSRRYAKRQIAFFKWIPAQKTYVGEDFYRNIVSDPWLINL